MPAGNEVTSVIVAGLGGQGVLKASDILAEVAFRSGLDVKKSEIHGMSQRGGSVTSDVRFGALVHSPMVPAGEAHYLVVAAADQVENNLCQLRPGGILIEPGQIDDRRLPNKRALNVALLGRLSRYLDFPDSLWRDAIRSHLAQNLHEANLRAFELGRASLD